MTLTRFAAAICALAAIAFPAVVHADIYKCVDDGGRITYTNAKASGKGCTLLSRDLPAASPRRSASSSRSEAVRDEPPARSYENSGASSGGFPRVDAGTQHTRDTSRRSILERELASEEKLLTEARQEALRTYANNQGAQLSGEKVQLHERNIQALRKEISKLK